MQELGRALRIGVLVLCIFGGAAWCVISGIIAFAAWLPETNGIDRIDYLIRSFIFGCWALFGVAVGPKQIGWLVFFVSSIFNAGFGIVLLMSTPSLPLFSIPFFVFSFWQFFVFRKLYATTNTPFLQ